jgi:hypothetical protein
MYHERQRMHLQRQDVAAFFAAALPLARPAAREGRGAQALEGAAA